MTWIQTTSVPNWRVDLDAMLNELLYAGLFARTAVHHSYEGRRVEIIDYDTGDIVGHGTTISEAVRMAYREGLHAWQTAHEPERQP